MKKVLFCLMAFVSVLTPMSVYSDTRVQYFSERSGLLYPYYEYKDALSRLLPDTGESRDLFVLFLGVFILILAVFIFLKQSKREEENEI